MNSDTAASGPHGDLVLVTGGSGFLGSHCILQLLEAGYRVRTTVRSLEREEGVRAMLRTGGAEPGGALGFAAADLTEDDGWADAVAGCRFVLHVASPFPVNAPKDEDELIVPAREGALRLLRAARDAGVERVVLTSSLAAVAYGNTPTVDGRFTEVDWTDPDAPGIGAYVKSKTLAERAAWNFVADEGGGLQLAVINPVAIFGPVLGADYAASVQILQPLLEGGIPAIPRVSLNTVDVRDVADLHLRAMVEPAAAGERFLALSGAPVDVPQIARILKARMGSDGARIPTRTLPDWVVKLGARFNPRLKAVVPQLGPAKLASSDKAKTMLGWSPRSNEEAVVATGESLVRLGLLSKSG